MRATGPNAKKLQKSNKLLNKYRSRFSSKPITNASTTSNSVTIIDPKVTSTMPTTSRFTNKTMTKNTYLKKISRLVSDSKLTFPVNKNVFKRSTLVSSTSTSSLATLTMGDSKKTTTTTTVKAHIKKAASVSNIKHVSSYMPPPIAKSKTTSRYQPPINRTTTITASKQLKNVSKQTQPSEIVNLPRSTLLRQQIVDSLDNAEASSNDKQLTHETLNLDEGNVFRQEKHKSISQRAIQCNNTGEQLSLCNNRFSFSSSFSSTSNSYNQYYPTSEPVNLFKSTRLEQSNEEEDGDEDDDEGDDNDDDDEDHLPFLSLSMATKNNDTISFLSQSQISINSQQPFIINKTNFQRSHLVENNDQLMDSIDEDL